MIILITESTRFLLFGITICNNGHILTCGNNEVMQWEIPAEVNELEDFKTEKVDKCGNKSGTKMRNGKRRDLYFLYINFQSILFFN